MSSDVFANLRSMTVEQRDELRRRLAERNLLDEHRSGPVGARAGFEVDASARARIAAAVPGGTDNIEGVYPLTPLQEGMLYHHLLAPHEDPYVLHQVMSFASRNEVNDFAAGLRTVIARHGILRSAMMWEGLPMPVQVVCRQVELPVFEVASGADGGTADWLVDQTTLPRYRIDVHSAPLMRLLCARDRSGDWLLVIASHHLIGDRISLSLMQQELETIATGGATRLAPARSFGEFALKVWAANFERAEAFFRDLLGDVDEPTAPFGLIEPVDARAPLAEARRTIERAHICRLYEQLGRHGVGMPAVVHVAWALVLARVSSCGDIVFGTVLSGRLSQPAQTKDMLGMLVNTLPFRVSLNERSVIGCLWEAQQLLSQLIEHEHAPLARTQRESAVPPPTPLFGALLDYRRELPRDRTESGDVASGSGGERTSFPLTLSIDDSGDSLRCVVQTFEECGPEWIAGALVESLKQVAQALADAPQRPVTSIDVAPDWAMAHYSAMCLDPDGPESSSADVCAHRLFEVQAARTPHGICLVSDHEVVSYAELDERARRLALELRRRGVTTEARVALCMSRSVEMIVAMLAVMKAGGAYVPLDPEYPEARLRLLIRLSRPALVLLGGSTHHDLFTHENLTVVDLDSIEGGDCRVDETLPCNPGGETSTQIAYVMFTSGSTGEPKGVQVEHRSVAAFARAHARWCGLNDTDRVLQFASYSFDNSVAEIFPALCVGAAVVLRPNGPVAPDEAFVAFLARHRVTVTDLPTAFWHLWAQRIGDGTCMPEPPLRLVLAGGEKAQHGALRQWFQAPETMRVRMGDTYGLTEATVNSIVGELTCAHASSDSPPPLGRPLGDTRTCIVDMHGRLTPVGLTGEICIGGPGVARGYLDRPALTAAHFLPDPFGPAGSRIYRTGDLGRWTGSGEIEYVGRTDAQIKIRGCRIEPAEIEEAFRTAADVRDAKVVSRGERLVGYVVGEAGQVPVADKLRADLGELLPSYMVPASIVAVPELPVNTHGKIDVAELPIPSDDSMDDVVRDPPATSAEICVASIWSELLERDDIGRDDDFFELGGHSLIAVRVISRVSASTGAAVAISDLFANPTLAAFAHAVGNADLVTPPVIERGGYQMQLSSAQERLWFLSRVDARQSAAYHLTGGLRLSGDLDTQALNASIVRIVERHEILRTVFPAPGGVPEPVVGSVAESYALHKYDLTAEDEPDARLAELFTRTSRDPFDLENGPLLRITLAKFGNRDHILIATMHHIIADGWSMSVFTSELASLYTSFSTGDEDPLSPLPFQYADYAVWEQNRISQQRKGSSFWQEHLRHAPTCLTLPADRARPTAQDYAGAGVTFLLDESLTRGLRTLATRHGTTLYTVLVAAYAVFLSRLAGQLSVVIGTPVANRRSVEVERLIGLFANTLPLHVSLDGAPTVSELIAQVKRTVLLAHERQHVPFTQIVDEVNPPRSRSYGPLFQTMLVWQNTPASKAALDGLEVTEVHPDVTTAQCDLSLMMEEWSEEIGGTAVYATALFERATIERYLEEWRAVLVSMTNSDTARIDQMTPASPTVSSGTSMPTARPIPPCLHVRIAEWAAATPDAIATVDDASSITYGDLNAAANRLARYLRTLGVGRGVPVALALPRNTNLVVGVLAVLKAGGAFVGLDPSLPNARVRQIIADCRPAVVLVDRRATEAHDLEVSVVDLCTDRPRWAHMPATDLAHSDVGVSLRDPAYVMYTSGSTGRPKGVVVEHAQVVSLLGSLGPALELRTSDVWTLFHSIAFDFSVWEMFGALLHGARLVIVPQSITRAPDAFYRLICREGVTVLSQTPGAFKQLIDVDQREPRTHRLRNIVFGGEQLDASMLARWFESNGVQSTTLTDMYGITECTVHTTARRLTHDDVAPDAARSVGRAIAGRHVYVLDERLQAAPAGVLGEIWIAGEGVSRGYLNRPMLTAERFIPDPFAQFPGERMYRTGDLGRLSADGELEFVGRADERVNIRGFRVEPGEVAAKLAGHPDVNQAVVRACAHDTGDIRLIAYFSQREPEQSRLSPTDLRTYLRDRVPDYMMPDAYKNLDVFPLTFNGKVDKEALPWPDPEDYPTRAYEPPQGNTETWLAQEWSKLLGVVRVGRRDHFFDLGGHSLQVAQLTARIHAAFDVDIPMHVIFEAPVLLEYAKRIVVARIEQFDPAELARLKGGGTHDWNGTDGATTCDQEDEVRDE